MNTLLAYMVMVVVLALVLRSMAVLNGVAASAGRLRPATARILQRVPLVAFGLWVASLLLRRTFLAETVVLWPFELAAAVALWLCWIAIVALVVAVHSAASRLGARRARVPAAATPMVRVPADTDRHERGRFERGRR